MNERVLILREAVVKIAQMLAGQGIKISQRGLEARVVAGRDGIPTEIILPFIPDNASEELCYAIQGFLDHEVAHVLFSDFSASLHDKANSENVHALMNAIEDARIEKRMAEKYAGSGLNISNTGAFFLKKIIEPKLKEAAAAGDAKKVQNCLMVPLIRALSGQSIFKEFLKDRMTGIQQVHDAIVHLADDIANVQSSQDSLNVALKIKEVLKGEGEGNGGDEGEPNPGDDMEDKTGRAPNKSNPSKSGAGKPEEKKSPPKKSESEEKEPGNGEGEPKPEPGEGEGDSGDGEGAGSESGEGEGSSTEGESSAPEGKTTQQETPPVWDELDMDSANDFDSSLSRAIGEVAEESMRDAPYRIFTKEADKIEPLCVGSGYRPEMFKALSESVDHMVGPLQKDLERAIAARSMKAWEPGKRSGRLNAASLSRLAVGDPRVFRKRLETTTKDVAVELVIDISGSMAGGKVHLATQSAYALSQVLERIGIKHEVVCFTTGHMPPHLQAEYDKAEHKLGRDKGYSRYEPIYMPVIKDFNERLSTGVKERFGWLPNQSNMRNNIDGESIQMAARRLMSRREAGKTMIVLSDGYPAAHGDMAALNRHLRETVRDIEKAGINTVGIGILDSAVEKFYRKNLVISNIEELPDRVIKELRHQLIQD